MKEAVRLNNYKKKRWTLGHSLGGARFHNIFRKSGFSLYHTIESFFQCLRFVALKCLSMGETNKIEIIHSKDTTKVVFFGCFFKC